MSAIRFGFTLSKLVALAARSSSSYVVSRPMSSLATPARILVSTSKTSFGSQQRPISNDSIDENRQPTEGEVKLTSILKSKFPKAKSIVVNDISGGCGSMYEIYVESSEFNNVRTVKQHQMINQALRTEITQNMHGLRIFTSPVEEK